MTGDIRCGQLVKRAPTTAAMVAAWLDRPSLTPVHPAALPASPRETRRGQHVLSQRVIDRHRQCAVPIHVGHFAEKIQAVIRAALEDVVLPLMDHFVGQGADEFIPAVRRREKGVRSGSERRISRFGVCATVAGPGGSRPSPLTNIPAEEVRRLLQSMSIGGRASQNTDVEIAP